MLNSEKPAGIEYHGVAGTTQNCVDAVLGLVQYHVNITKALLLTAGQRHYRYPSPHKLIRIPNRASGHEVLGF
uniref:Uncharacterized protein n=1 Tax=Candidatus Kentrum sp. LFY TaxID=2126342 RepID=A0A450WKE2_9GAMM|nr:MAG: hypothetical protein BECKLFY1418C_GA0070996_103212 [Candidatus Kentron sp. LFY]